MPFSVRLDSKTERMISRLADESGQTKSSVIREAIGSLARDMDRPRRSRGPYATIKDLLGCVHGGPSDLSVRTGVKFRRILTAKAGK